MLGFPAWSFPSPPSPSEVRAELWNLGVRHHGEPLSGAIEELAAGGLSTSRTSLLRACVRQLGGRA